MFKPMLMKSVVALFTISCTDAKAQAVRAVQTANGVFANATTD